MQRADLDPTPPVLLLVAGLGDWFQAAKEAARREGGTLVRVETPADAIERLVGAPNRFSHLLLPAGIDGPQLADLIALSAGEAHTGTGLVLLGWNGAAPPDATVVSTPDAGAIARLLIQRTTRPAPAAPIQPAEIQNALAAGLLEVRYQPIVRISDRAPCGFEALSRLRHPHWGTLAPSGFVPQIEHAGLSGSLVAATSAGALRSLPPGFTEQSGLRLSLNFPLAAFVAPDAIPRLDEQRADAGLTAARLVVELTESQPVTDVPAVADAARRWAAAGYALAIDDAGPDVGNLPALYKLPFSMVKLDKGIVRRSASDQQAATYLRRTVHLAQGRGLSVVAEGVETQQDWDRMAAFGVDQAQGFLIARALPHRAVPVWMRNWAVACQ